VGNPRHTLPPHVLDAVERAERLPVGVVKGEKLSKLTQGTENNELTDIGGANDPAQMPRLLRRKSLRGKGLRAQRLPKLAVANGDAAKNAATQASGTLGRGGGPPHGRKARNARPPRVVPDKTQGIETGASSTTPPGPLVVEIVPVAKPRMTQRDKWAKRPAVMRYRRYCDELRSALGDWKMPCFGRQITFCMPMPKSWSETWKVSMEGKPHQARPDIDNLTKGILDALFDNDAVVWDIRATKRWSMRPRIEIALLTYNQ